MKRLALVLIAAVALIGLSAASGLDRMARSDPAVAARVPGPFAAAALRTMGGQALAGGRGADAAAFGWHAVNRAPTDAEAVALLAAGRLASGDSAGAQRAFEVAGKMGWRVPITQAYWFDRAIEARDFDSAAMRLDALLRQMPTLVGQQALLDRVEQSPEARTALIERLDPQTAWLGKYIHEVFALPPQVLRQRATLMLEAARFDQELALGCTDGADLTAAMTNLKLYREGLQFWLGQCPDDATSLLGDPLFSRLNLQGSRSPFDWAVVGNGEVLLGLANAAPGQPHRLTVDGTPPIARTFLTKLLVLAPGRYVLSWRAGDSSNRPSPKIRAALGCKGAEPVWLEPVPDRASGRWAAVVTVPACEAQVLAFSMAAGGGSLWLEAIRLDPLG